MKLLHLKIFIAVWVIVMIAGVLVPKELLTANLYTSRVMNLATFLWICSCFVAFWMGTFIERTLYAGNGATAVSNIKTPLLSEVELAKMLKTFKAVLVVVIGVIFIRFIWCVIIVGSLENTFLFAATRPHWFKFDVWQQTTIHGMGAASDVVAGCVVFASALVALMKKYRGDPPAVLDLGYDPQKTEDYYRTSVRLLYLSLVALIIYAVLSGERVALVMGSVGGFIAHFLILRRFPLKQLIFFGAFLMVVWVLVEGYRRRYFGSEDFSFILEYAKDRLLLYLVSGLRNVDTVVNYLPNHTYGAYTFGFALITLKLEFLFSVSDSLYGFSSHQVKPGFGVIPVFGTAYADFGVASLLYFVIFGFIYQRLFRKAILENSFLAVQLYAFFLAALLISFMPFMPTIARFWVNVLAMVVMSKSVRFSLRD
jgi:hypothetical protein